MHAFISERDEYNTTRLLQWNATSEGTTMLLFHVDGPKKPYLATLEEMDSVRTYETTDATTDPHESGDQFYLFVQDRITGDGHQLAAVTTTQGMVTVPPILFRTDRSAELTFVGTETVLTKLVNRIPDRMNPEIWRIGTDGGTLIDSGAKLTARQREVLATAVDCGYYTEPRNARIVDVAERLDVTQGTVAEHLRKAEAQLVRDALGRQGGD